MNVTLTDEFRDFVRQKVESGEFPNEEAVLQEALRRFRRAEDPRVPPTRSSLRPTRSTTTQSPTVQREIQGKDVPSIEEVRRILSKVPGSWRRPSLRREKADPECHDITSIRVHW